MRTVADGTRAVHSGTPAAFALCRPPGHHAHADMCGGYCFLNNAAIAAQQLLAFNIAQPNPPKVAILDVDFHHGNGTQHIFYGRNDVLFVSLHADPDWHYPYFSGAADERGAGDGEGYTLNFPLPPRIADDGYLAVLGQACDNISRFMPDYLVVSLGVDTFEGDPLGDFALSARAFGRIGGQLAQLGLPTLIVMEGGYAVEQLGDNVIAVLGAFDGT